MYFIFDFFVFFAARIFPVAINIARKRRGARGDGEGVASYQGQSQFQLNNISRL